MPHSLKRDGHVQFPFLSGSCFPLAQRIHRSLIECPVVRGPENDDVSHLAVRPKG
jgi:hypothetical protein